MKHIIITYLPYLLSLITAYTMLLAGNKRAGAWLVGLLNQSLWLLWIITSQTWGLLPMCIVMTIVYIRNYVKWK